MGDGGVGGTSLHRDEAVLWVDEASVVHVEGPLDLASAPGLRSVLHGMRSSAGPLRIDFSEVTFMDSSGLRVLIDINTMCPVHVLNPSRPVRLLFEMAAVTNVLHIE